MPRYKVTVLERVVHEYEYEVDADSAEEAKLNALESCFEQQVAHPGRTDIEPQREVWVGEPELIADVE
jgi:hypothetical protein